MTGCPKKFCNVLIRRSSIDYLWVSNINFWFKSKAYATANGQSVQGGVIASLVVEFANSVSTWWCYIDMISSSALRDTYRQKMIRSFLAADQEWAMVVPTATRRPHILRQLGGGRRSRRQAPKLFRSRHQEAPNCLDPGARPKVF